MERTSLYEDDLTDEREATPIEREENAHTVALDPDVDDDDEDDEDEDLDDDDE